MNWKEHAYLFANGKFAFKLAADNEYRQIDAYYNGRLGTVIPPMGLKYFHASNCYIIARKIEDMTDEEIKNSPEYDSTFSINFYKKILTRQSQEGSIRHNEFIYLLSIGVYPFDQSAFDNGTVIDAKH